MQLPTKETCKSLHSKRLIPMNHIIFLLGICLSLSFSGFAQTYNFSGGIRLGTEYGFTFKYRIANKLTLEGIIQSPVKDNVAITSLLLEKHNSILTKGFNIYLGGGIQKGWVLSDDVAYGDPFGLVGIIGAEFNFAKLNLSYDIKPAVNFVGGSSTVNLQTGISVRYIFSKNGIFEIDPKKREKKKKKRLKSREKRKKIKQKLKDRYRKKNTLYGDKSLNMSYF